MKIETTLIAWQPPPGTTASGRQLAGVDGTLTGACVAEPDGYHHHRYLLGTPGWWRAEVVEHLHAWMTTDQPAASIHVGSNGEDTATLADAWRQLVAHDPRLPAIPPPVACCALVDRPAADPTATLAVKLAVAARLTGLDQSGDITREGDDEWLVDWPRVAQRALDGYTARWDRDGTRRRLVLYGEWEPAP